MARIPDDVVERLKREVSVVRLVEASGVELKKHGENVMGRCPFHDDKTPSLVVTPSKNLWHCLGACQAGGSVIDWVMRREKCSMRAALEMLLKDAPSLAAPLDASPAPTTRAKLQEIVRPEESDSVVLGRVVDFYHTTLCESAEAGAYLGSRGLAYSELVDTFKLGFANRTLAYRLPVKQVKAGEAVRSQLQRLGVLRESGHEHFNGSIVVPIFDAAGEVVEMYGRKITPNLRPGTAQHLYLPGPHRGILNPQAFSAGGEIILCEAILDALTFWAAGLRNVTTSYGVEGFTPELRDAFVAHGKKRVLIAYDRDDAGEKAAAKLAPELAAMGHEVFRVLFPRGMDANEYAQKVKPAAKSLETALRAAHWMAGSRPVQVPSEVVTAQAPVLPASAPELADAVAFAGAAESKVIPSLAADHADEREREEEHERPAVPAAAAPLLAPSRPVLEVRDNEAVMSFGPRTWKMRGLEKVSSLASIKVSVRVSTPQAFFADSLDVVSARARAGFTKIASEELQLEERIIKSDLARLLDALEQHVEEKLREKLQPVKAAPVMTEAERAEALLLLKDPKLMDRILEDFARCGVVGEETNKLVGYLAAVSRKLEAPLAVVVQSSSAAGKSSLMDAVLQFVPPEEKLAYSAMTGQSLFYMSDLSHKVLAIAEEEGASKASYALKVLQSSGELTIASTGKDERTGRLMTHEYQVQGPVMVMMTTTSVDIDEELLNRCLVLTVDEGSAQTQAIQALQRDAETLEGMKARAVQGKIMALHQNAQRLLQPVRVVNEHAPSLTFASHATRTRRDQKKYLSLIRCVALLHQHQREVKTDPVIGRYIEVTERDVEIAAKLAGKVLARGLDELAPQTRRLLSIIDALVSEQAGKQGIERSDVRFTQRELRERAKLGLSQLKVHLKTLVDHEYLAAHRNGHAQRNVFELLVSAGEEVPGPFSHDYDRNRSVEEPNRPAISTDRPGTGRGAHRPVFLSDSKVLGQPAGDFDLARRGFVEERKSYADLSRSPDAAE